MSTVSALTGASRAELPPPCVDCLFWQHDRLTSDARRKDAWVQAFERRNGAFGRVLHAGTEFRGMIQYGPAAAFPRALALPCGPPARDAALITCAFLEGDDPGGTCERLVLEALADLKARGTAAAEAFALRHPDEVPHADRFLGHHTLFDRDFLESMGFREVRAHGQVALMRLELAGLVPVESIIERARRLVADTLPPRGRPAPAT